MRALAFQAQSFRVSGWVWEMMIVLRVADVHIHAQNLQSNIGEIRGSATLHMHGILLSSRLSAISPPATKLGRHEELSRNRRKQNGLRKFIWALCRAETKISEDPVEPVRTADAIQ